MNQTLQKLAATAANTYAAWQKQMRRDGFTKREQLSADSANPASMKPAARALFMDYAKAQADLDAEAANASQPELPILEMLEPAKLGDVPGYPGVPGLAELPVVNVAAFQLDSFLNALSLDDLLAPKPKAKLVAHAGTGYVALAEHGPGVLAVRAYPASEFQGEVLTKAQDGQPFRVQFGTKKALTVVGTREDCVLIVHGDPLSNIAAPGASSAPTLAQEAAAAEAQAPASTATAEAPAPTSDSDDGNPFPQDL